MWGAVEPPEDRAHFIARQHHGEVLGAPGAHDLVQRLILRGRRDLAVGGEPRQESRDLGRAHLGWMALAVEEDVALVAGVSRTAGAVYPKVDMAAGSRSRHYISAARAGSPSR